MHLKPNEMAESGIILLNVNEIGEGLEAIADECLAWYRLTAIIAITIRAMIIPTTISF